MRSALLLGFESHLLPERSQNPIVVLDHSLEIAPAWGVSGTGFLYRDRMQHRIRELQGVYEGHGEPCAVV